MLSDYWGDSMWIYIFFFLVTQLTPRFRVYGYRRWLGDSSQGAAGANLLTTSFSDRKLSRFFLKNPSRLISGQRLSHAGTSATMAQFNQRPPIKLRRSRLDVGVKVARKFVLTVDVPEIPDSVQFASLPPPRRDKSGGAGVLPRPVGDVRLRARANEKSLFRHFNWANNEPKIMQIKNKTVKRKLGNM